MTAAESGSLPPKAKSYFRNFRLILCILCVPIILDLTVVLNFAIDGVWINFLDDFGERFRERSVR